LYSESLTGSEVEFVAVATLAPAKLSAAAKATPMTVAAAILITSALLYASWVCREWPAAGSRMRNARVRDEHHNCN
jgi:hypothetical protein